LKLAEAKCEQSRFEQPKAGTMEQPSEQARHAQSTRRWPRHEVDLPVGIIAQSEAMVRSGFLPSSVVGGSPELRTSVRSSCNPQTLYAGLRQQEELREELRKVQREVEALHGAITLRTDDEEELSRLSPPCPST
jgi:hypothetical protein